MDAKYRLAEIELTTACTRNCWFCRPAMLPDDITNPPYLSVEDHQRFINDLVSQKYSDWLIYCGHGEPLCHPGMGELVALAREAMPDGLIALATNGDLITVDWLKTVGVLFDSIAWDCYDNDETSRRVPRAVKESGFPPSKFSVIDCTIRPDSYWLSRAGAGFDSEIAATRRRLNIPNLLGKCLLPHTKLFYSARGMFCLCCNDGHRRLRRRCSLSEWLEDPEYAQAKSDLAVGHRAPHEQCVNCEYYGEPSVWPENGMNGLYPQIDKTRFWNET